MAYFLVLALSKKYTEAVLLLTEDPLLLTEDPLL